MNMNSKYKEKTSFRPRKNKILSKMNKTVRTYQINSNFLLL